MQKANISIGSKDYEVKLAQTDDEKEKGLQDITELPEKEGMLFVFDEPDEISF